jgi:hypothetical protein
MKIGVELLEVSEATWRLTFGYAQFPCLFLVVLLVEQLENG